MWRLKQNQRAQVMLVVIVLVVLGSTVGTALAFRSSRQPKPTSQSSTNVLQNSNQAQKLRRLLDGVFVETQQAAAVIPVSIMIENLSLVRPQRGLGEASVVYEALAEGGITRFMAVFAGPGQMSSVGPVRSSREYFVDWADEYGGVYAHVGGSPQALEHLSGDQKLVDLNQIGGDQIYFWRDSETEAPHNLLTSSEKMAFAIRDYLGEQPVASFEPWLFKEDAVKADRPTGDHHVQIDFSTDSYAVDWKYERKTNTYVRSNGGEAQVDQLTNEPLRAHTVVVQFVATSLVDQATGRLDMQTVGTGEAVIFVDGQRIDGTWKKSDEGARTRFYNKQDEEVKFNAGTIWIEVVPDDRAITSI